MESLNAALLGCIGDLKRTRVGRTGRPGSEVSKADAEAEASAGAGWIVGAGNHASDEDAERSGGEGRRWM